MRRRAVILLVATLLAGGLMGAVLSRAQTPTMPTIRVELPHAIRAGQALEIELAIAGAGVGEKADALLFNGLRRHSAQLELGTGGVAVWRIPAETITHAGESLLIIRYGEAEIRRGLTVRSDAVQSVDLLTTANNIAAYGESRAVILALPRDRWGSAPQDMTGADGEAQYPDGETRPLNFTYRSGLGWASLHSHGEPGRVRIRLDIDTALGMLEINQLAGRVYTIDLTLSPECVLDDGRDKVTLAARVQDRRGYPVVDGTLVTFTWRGGRGFGQTIDGQAALRLPAPMRPGIYRYTAAGGGVEANMAALTVTGATCPDG